MPKPQIAFRWPILCPILGVPTVVKLAASEFTPTDSERIIDLSGDGRYILQRDGFQISGMSTTNLSVLDFETRHVDPVNLDPAGQFVAADRGTISADGRYVVFESANYRSIYLRDRQAQTTQLISISPGGEAASGSVVLPSISPDGSRVVFFTNAANLVPDSLPAATTTLANLILWDRATNALSVAARAADGGILSAGVFMDPGLCQRRFSADGRYIVYGTPATNAAAGASVSNGQLILLYRRDLDSAEVVAVSTNPSGTMAPANYTYPAVSNDGRFVTFITSLQGIFGEPMLPGAAANFGAEVYRKDLQTGAVLNISATTDGKAPDGSIQGTSGRGSSPISISADENLIAFQSTCGKLTADNPEKTWGVFLATVTGADAVTLQYLSSPKNGGPGGLLSFVGEGAEDRGNGLIYSPVMGWLQFCGETGWAYSYALAQFVTFDLAGPGIGNPAGFWMYLLDEAAQYWAFTTAALWSAGNNDLFRTAYLYVPAGRSGSPGWFHYDGELDAWLGIGG